MESDEGSDRLRSFLLGGLVGASAVIATARRARRRVRRRAAGPAGLAAFEGAPCYREAEGAPESERSSR